KIYGKRGSLADVAGHAYVPVALLDDSINRREPEARSFPLPLGREKRFEEAVLRDLVHAAAGIAHGERYVVPGWHRGRTVPLRSRHQAVRGNDCQLPAVRHGIASIDG